MKKILIVFFSCLFLFACKKDDDVSLFVGDWAGNYLGADDNGTFLFTVRDDGSVTGIANSLIFPATYNFVGTVSQTGDIIATEGTSTSGVTFKGTFNGTTVKGTWTNTLNGLNYSGTWSGTRQ